MALITVLPDRLCEWFSDMTDFDTCTFCTQFPAESKITPLDKPVVVFGAESIHVLDNTTDETGTIITDSRMAKSKFSIGIHMPRSEGGIVCNSLLEGLLDLLLFDTPLSVSDVQSYAIEYIRNTDSLYLKTVFTVSETLERGTSYPKQLTI